MNTARSPPQRTRRRTPVDDKSLIQEWREQHKNNIEELGLSNRQSYYRISKNYGCSWGTAQYWINKNVRRLSIQQKRDIYLPYSKSGSKRIKYRKSHSQIYSDIRRRPDIYLDEIFQDAETSMSLDEITLRLKDLTGIFIRNKVFLNSVKRYENKIGAKLFEEINCRDPPVYRLV